MSTILVDSNVLLDVINQDEKWLEWSQEALLTHAESHTLAINPIVYAEISIQFDRIEDLDDVLLESRLARIPLPFEAGFLAGKCFLQYRKRGGNKHAPLPDFYIGAHAAIENIPLMTRDSARYRTYFPRLKLIAPK